MCEEKQGNFIWCWICTPVIEVSNTEKRTIPITAPEPGKCIHHYLRIMLINVLILPTNLYFSPSFIFSLLFKDIARKSATARLTICEVSISYSTALRISCFICIVITFGYWSLFIFLQQTVLMELKIKENIERTAGDLVCPAVSRYYIWYDKLNNFNAIKMIYLRDILECFLYLVFFISVYSWWKCWRWY